MKGKNEKDHHFISVTEMKANSLSGNGCDRKKIQIEIFEKTSDLGLRKCGDDKSSKAIKNNYEKFLFHISTDDSGSYLNLENDFKKYEEKNFDAIKNLKELANAVLDVKALGTKESDIDASLKNSIVDVLCLKYLNLLRNPYRIKEVIAMGNRLLAYEGCSDESSSFVDKINQEANPRLSEICSKYGCTAIEYKKWLEILIRLLLDKEGDRNRFEKYIISILGRSSPDTKVSLYLYDNGQYCLLSDKAVSFIAIEIPKIDEDVYLNNNAEVFYINIAKDLFMILKIFPSSNVAFNGEVDITLDVVKNCMVSLNTFNHKMIREAEQYVFCASNNLHEYELYVNA